MSALPSRAEPAPPLAERGAELARLEALVQGVAGGEGSALLVLGEPGIGKTRLLDAAAAMARDSDIVAVSTCGAPLEAGFAWGAARDLLLPIVSMLDTAGRAAAFDGAAGLARDPLEGTVPAVDDAGARAHGLYWLLAALAGRHPLLVLADDAQWIDEASLTWLAYCSRRLGGLPVGLVIAARDGEGPPTLGALRADPDVEGLRLAPLGAEGVRATIGERAGAEPSDAVVQACLEASGGNPFLLTELLSELGPGVGQASPASLADMHPERVTESVAQRLADMPGSDADLARVLAVLGDGCLLRHAAELAGLPAEGAVATCERLADRAILDRGEAVRFAHPMIREAVYTSITPARRSHDHARAAALLHAQGAAPAEVAAHLLRTEPTAERWAADALVKAGQAALSGGDTGAALAFLTRAAEEPSTPEQRTAIARALGMAKLLSGQAGAIEHLRGAIPAAATTGERADIGREVALALLGEGRLDEGAALLEEVADGLDLERDRELRLRVEGDLACLAMIRSDMIEVAARRIMPLIGGLAGRTPAERVLLGAVAGFRDASGEPLAETWPMARSALGGGGLVEHSLPGSRAWVICANIGIDYDQMDEVDPVLDHALRDARARGSVGGFATASAWRAQSALLRGDLVEAEADARAALTASRQPGAVLLRPMAGGLLLAVLAERGSVAEADALMAELAERMDPAHRLWAFVPYYRAQVLLATGRVEQGVAELVAFGRHIDEASLAGHRWQWRTVAAPHLAAAGERDLAIRLVNEELAAAVDLPVSWRGAALRTLGVCVGGTQGLDSLGEAVTVLEGSVRRLELARARVELGVALRGAGHERDSREPLREGLDLATRLGATRLADRARSELLAAGGRPRRASLRGVDALTPSELRTTRMAAEGLTNAEIAQAVFVTTKTVEAHLTRAYRKLGVSREGLAAKLSGR